MSTGALAGITVLDLSRVLSGPYCTMLAADMGARVIKIEQPDHGDDTRAWGPPFVEGESAYYLSVNRNKESVALNFKRPGGRAILDRLIAMADIFVENFRPGTLNAMGLDYATLARAHPRLIYASISGFGQTGPRRTEPGYDAMIQAEGGLMSITGTPDGPPVRLGVAISDITAGMFAFQGILLALLARERSRRGQYIDVGMLDTTAALLTYQASRYFATGDVPSRLGNRHASIAPYDTFDAEDGTFVLSVGNDEQWQRFCAAADLPALATEERFATNASRVRHCDTLRGIIAERLASAPIAHWIDRLTAAGVPAGAVRSIDEVLADPQLASREMITTTTHPTIGTLRTLGVPVKLSDTPGSVRSAPPRLGEHTAHVLRHDLGLNDDQISALAADGAIGVLPT